MGGKGQRKRQTERREWETQRKQEEKDRGRDREREIILLMDSVDLTSSKSLHHHLVTQYISQVRRRSGTPHIQGERL